MLGERLYRILEYPLVYKATQYFCAPGAEWRLQKLLRDLSQNIPDPIPALDVGCGPSSWLGRLDLDPVGLDLSRSYVSAYRQDGGKGLVGSSGALPFPNNTFSSVWTIGLLHHLDDATAAGTLEELVRVCRPGGRVIVLDGVLPASRFKRPLAYLIRRMDRGRHMRDQLALERLLPNGAQWSVTRATYALTGLEILVCVREQVDES